MAGGGAMGSYSKKIGYVYIFNLVCGVGALMLPLAFNEAGLILGLLFLGFCAFLAYICVTYVIEVMACSNVLLRQQEQERASEMAINGELDNESLVDEDNGLDEYGGKINGSGSPTPSLLVKLKSKIFGSSTEAESTGLLTSHSSAKSDDITENDLLIPTTQKHTVSKKQAELKLFSIVTQTELGLCAEQFLGFYGKILFYMVIIFYLYGDLAIYAVSVFGSVYQVTGPIAGLSETNTCRIYALIFSVFIVPLCYLNFSKTKYLQLFTMFMRNVALALMIVLSLVFVFEGKGASFKDLKKIDFGGIGVLYGVTIYSFMCHHSLPGIVSPIKNKRGINALFLLDFATIFATYILLCYTAMFAFGNQKNSKCEGHACQIQKLYTYNFSYTWPPVGYFLALFPVFTLSSNFPLIAITLRGNIMTLFKDVKAINDMHWLPKRLIFSSIATLPPLVLVFFVQDITKLASLTGGFAGLGIQFFFPAIMVFFARRKMSQVFKRTHVKNPHGSWFQSFLWIELVVAFATVGLIYQSAMEIISAYKWVSSWTS